MRLLLKLSAAVMLAVALQCLSVRAMGLLDEAQFMAQAFYADATGASPGSPELLDAADRLRERQNARWVHAQEWPLFEPVLAWWNPRDWQADAAADSS